jgi:hypothetical protein
LKILMDLAEVAGSSSPFAPRRSAEYVRGLATGETKMSIVKHDQVMAIPPPMQKETERHRFKLITDGDIAPQDVFQINESISSAIGADLKLDTDRLLDIIQKDPNTTIKGTFNHKATGFKGSVKEVVDQVAAAMKIAFSGSTPSLVEKLDAALGKVFTSLAEQEGAAYLFFSPHGSSTTYRYMLLGLAKSAQSPLRIGALLAFEITIDKKREDVLELMLSDKATFDVQVLGPIWATLLV